MKTNIYDVIIVGSGAAGSMAAIESAKSGKTTLLIEKLPKLGSKLKATGGGRCNLTNTLDTKEFMQSFGRDGRFMQDALSYFNNKDLVEFFNSLGVQTACNDGFRIFPASRSSQSILDALEKEMLNLGVVIKTSQELKQINISDQKIQSIQTQDSKYTCSNLILATGGLGFENLGATGDGLDISKKLGHTITPLHPAMLPLETKETWVANCTADTIAKVELKIDIKKYSKLSCIGDLIFTKKGIRGPVVLDFSREVTPLLDVMDEVPLLANFTKSLNQEELHQKLKNNSKENQNIIDTLTILVPVSLAKELCKLCKINIELTYATLSSKQKENLLKTLRWTPLTVIGSDGFKNAMITRGGIKLKEINPKTMQSKLINGLYFCGEIMNLDGPCGGYNLQFSFASGKLAGMLN